MAYFRSFEDVDKWIAAKGENGVEKLRGRLETGAISGANAAFATAWLNRHDRIAAGLAQTKEQELAERATLAAEVSAEAASEATRAAHESAKWTKWAAVAAAAALIVSAWPYIKDVGR